MLHVQCLGTIPCFSSSASHLLPLGCFPSSARFSPIFSEQELEHSQETQLEWSKGTSASCSNHRMGEGVCVQSRRCWIAPPNSRQGRPFKREQMARLTHLLHGHLTLIPFYRLLTVTRQLRLPLSITLLLLLERILFVGLDLGFAVWLVFG